MTWALSERLSLLASLSRSFHASSSCFRSSLFSCVDCSIKLLVRSLDLSASSVIEFRLLSLMSFFARLNNSAVLAIASSISDSAFFKLPLSSTTVMNEDLFFSMDISDENSLRILLYSFSMSSMLDWNSLRSCSWSRSFCLNACNASDSSKCRSNTWSRAFLSSLRSSCSCSSSIAISFLAFSSELDVTVVCGLRLNSETPDSNKFPAEELRSLPSETKLCDRSLPVACCSSFFSRFSFSLASSRASWRRLFARLILSNRSSSSHLSFIVL